MTEIKICDVSLRDGMQILNRHAVIPLEARLQLAEALVRAHVPYIEVGSFVNPRVVPAMSDTIAVGRPISRLNKVDLPTLGRPTIATRGFMLDTICELHSLGLHLF